MKSIKLFNFNDLEPERSARENETHRQSCYLDLNDVRESHTQLPLPGHARFAPVVRLSLKSTRSTLFPFFAKVRKYAVSHAN
jgi:hypothetical protein